MKKTPKNSTEIVVINKIAKRKNGAAFAVYLNVSFSSAIIKYIMISLFLYTTGSRLDFMPRDWTRNWSLYWLSIFDFVVKTLVTIIFWKFMYLFMDSWLSLGPPSGYDPGGSSSNDGPSLPPEKPTCTEFSFFSQDPESLGEKKLNEEQTVEEPKPEEVPPLIDHFEFRFKNKRDWNQSEWHCDAISQKIEELFVEQNKITLSREEYDRITNIYWEKRKKLEPRLLRSLRESFLVRDPKFWAKYWKVIRIYNKRYGTNYKC